MGIKSYLVSKFSKNVGKGGNITEKHHIPTDEERRLAAIVRRTDAEVARTKKYGEAYLEQLRVNRDAALLINETAEIQAEGKEDDSGLNKVFEAALMQMIQGQPPQSQGTTQKDPNVLWDLNYQEFQTQMDKRVTAPITDQRTTQVEEELTPPRFDDDVVAGQVDKMLSDEQQKIIAKLPESELLQIYDILKAKHKVI